MVEYEELINKIHDWAHRRKIDQADPRVEFMKMAEELGELSAAYTKQNHDRLVDSIGDLQFALLIFSQLVGGDHKEALTAAYREIADRQGETTSAVFSLSKAILKRKIRRKLFMKLISWNIDSINAALTGTSTRAEETRSVLHKIAGKHPDVIAIQETKLSKNGPTK